MPWFPRPGAARANPNVRHLREFARTRAGVEAFLEPRTGLEDASLVLVAADGEWTRRPVAGPRAAARLTRSLRIPLYRADLVGYPQRMRDWRRPGTPGRTGGAP